jgi:hypothetical protein
MEAVTPMRLVCRPYENSCVDCVEHAEVVDEACKCELECRVPTAAFGQRVSPTCDLCTGLIWGIACGACFVRSGTPMGTVSAQVFGLEIRVKNITTNATT